MKTYLMIFLCLLYSSCYQFPDTEYPRLETLCVSNINNTGTTANAKINFEGSQNIVSYGFIWGEGESIDFSSDEFSIYTGKPGKEFSGRLDRVLEKNKEYQVKAFVQTEEFLVYGQLFSFMSEGSNAPVINSFEPLEVNVNDTILINGDFFSNNKYKNFVKFDNRGAIITECTNQSIRCIVPFNIASGEVSISVIVANTTTKASQKLKVN